MVQAHLIAVIPLAAVFLARGYGSGVRADHEHDAQPERSPGCVVRPRAARTSSGTSLLSFLRSSLLSCPRRLRRCTSSAVLCTSWLRLPLAAAPSVGALVRGARRAGGGRVGAAECDRARPRVVIREISFFMASPWRVEWVSRRGSTAPLAPADAVTGTPAPPRKIATCSSSNKNCSAAWPRSWKSFHPAPATRRCSSRPRSRPRRLGLHRRHAAGQAAQAQSAPGGRERCARRCWRRRRSATGSTRSTSPAPAS